MIRWVFKVELQNRRNLVFVLDKHYFFVLFDVITVE